MPNPRRKISRSKRDKRRASWAAKLKTSHLSICENCSEMKIPHHVCPHCGYYKGKAIYTPESVS
jgi:large subunit ribosomal protein L32